MATDGHRRLRSGRASLRGQIYLVTTVTAHRTRIFGDWPIASATCRCLAEAVTWGDAQALCWVLMPDHWHGLVRLGDHDTLPTTVNRLKARMTKAVHATAPAIAKVWARAYHDHAVRREEGLRSVARYLILNPVRAGLVRRVGDYPYWDSIWLPRET